MSAHRPERTVRNVAEASGSFREQNGHNNLEKLRQLLTLTLVIGGDAFFSSHTTQLAALTASHAVPAVYQQREFSAAGGLMSYGTSIADTHRLAEIYAGGILKGDKPADLPVQQSTKVELFLNFKPAELSFN
jgi:putative ABC transport system substrate-binding protein